MTRPEKILLAGMSALLTIKSSETRHFACENEDLPHPSAMLLDMAKSIDAELARPATPTPAPPQGRRYRIDATGETWIWDANGTQRHPEEGDYRLVEVDSEEVNNA